jgi:hypothetical protein
VNLEKRLAALVRQVDISPPSRHTVGLPFELTGEIGGSTPLPEARVLILEVALDESLLWRYSSLSEFAGDTWHENDVDALEQAELEYGDRVGSWTEYPLELTHEQVVREVLGRLGGE